MMGNATLGASKFGTQGDGTLAVVCPQTIAFDSAAC